MNNISHFRNELEIYASSVLSINRMIRAFECELNKEFDVIKASSDYLECVGSFDSIFSIQRCLAVAKHRYEFNLSNFIDDFVYKFDRDDMHSRKYIYEVIKSSCDIEDATSRIKV